MTQKVRVRLIRWLCIFVWLLIHLAILWGLTAGKLIDSVTLLVLVLGSPLYVYVVHKLDQKFDLVGFRCVNVALEGLPKDKTRTDSSTGNEFRRTLRLEMLAITSGFAATLFLMCIELYLDWDSSAVRPSLILVAMAVLFFFASILNLVQIIMYDFFLSTRGFIDPAVVTLRKQLEKKLNRFHDVSWHILVAPAVLAFFLINPLLCMGVNFFYGCLLFLYYFFDIADGSIDFCKRLSVELPPNKDRMQNVEAHNPGPQADA